MEGFQSLFKIHSGSTAANGRLTVKPPLPTPSLPTSAPPALVSQHGPAQISPDGSLVQSLAARFVLSSSLPQNPDDVLDGKKMPQSKGGNPLRQQELISTRSVKLDKNPGNVETPNVQLKRPEKDAHTTMSAIVLGWLITQREMLKDLADMRSTTVKNHNLLLKNQESTQAQVLVLVKQLQVLQKEITAYHLYTQEQRMTLKRLVLVTGLVNLLLMFLAMSWSSWSLRSRCFMWYGRLKHQVFHPVLTALTDYKNFSQSVVSQALSSFHLFKSVWR
ncbi:uncharacterized protein [Haliotis asinina]|uniref:uncharacterized protein isoform X2 n=1 Tax=Haliotis asinina TaxID=109174 RepID=UPI003531CB52